MITAAKAITAIGLIILMSTLSTSRDVYASNHSKLKTLTNEIKLLNLQVKLLTQSLNFLQNDQLKQTQLVNDAIHSLTNEMSKLQLFG
jgi:archaellum component FlaC